METIEEYTPEVYHVDKMVNFFEKEHVNSMAGFFYFNFVSSALLLGSNLAFLFTLFWPKVKLGLAYLSALLRL